MVESQQLEDKEQTMKQNGVVWIDGIQSEWSQAQVPIMSDSVNRSVNVFDSLIAVEQPGTGIGVIELQSHVERLFSTCRAMNISPKRHLQQAMDDCMNAAQKEYERTGAQEIYVRPMVVGYDITNQDKNGASLTVAAFSLKKGSDKYLHLITAGLRRPRNASMPPAWKATANYHLTRMVRLQAEASGADDALLLNESGRIAETAGAAIIVDRGGVITTPSRTEDCLPSITINIVEGICSRLGIPFSREPLHLTDVYGAKGAATAGTLGGITSVHQVDHCHIPDSEQIQRIKAEYEHAIRGKGLEGVLDITVLAKTWK
ncbi:MAG: aminotransferase class IV [Paenarthrobacter ureafaciens]|uniref:aminotransferase class IV n=1 Tax=Paenarthrobacter ureafaciens TaxID=37931 RepID=UPI001ACA9B8D|nr:aminotransferase class IV [Paenarthrobacter ureafaciens]MBN9131735.1 aminotransferase class IV [Paenarthrobacter ureafaciens]